MKKSLLVLGLLLLAGPCFAEFNIETEVAKYVNTLQGEELAKSNAYFDGQHWIRFWDTLLGCIVASILMMTEMLVRG